MVLFGKREVVFKTVGGRERWKIARNALKSAGIQIMEAGSYEGEIPICGCGAKIDRRNYGPNGWIDRRVYYVAVPPKDTERARNVLLDAVGVPLERDELVLPAKKARAESKRRRHGLVLKGLWKRYFGQDIDENKMEHF